ncbi:hypothetical protein DRN69_06565 [Candidatus Pacearchaeota archaeon]|nr:MAG: hypothetical protein DRN69_06565 [Candidatus Pacearchaeota archaeon]
MSGKIHFLIKGQMIKLEQEKFPVDKAKFIEEDCGGFLHFIGKSDNSNHIYGLFLKKENCSLEEQLIYKGDMNPMAIARVNLNSDFGRQLNNKYLTC